MRIIGADRDQTVQREVGNMGREPLEPLAIDDRDLRARIADAIGELVAQPPGVERGDDHADRHAGPEGERPFGQVAHGDDQPIALADAEAIVKHAAKLPGGAEMRGIGLPLALVDDELAVAPAAREVKHLAQVVQRVDIGAQADAADHLLARLERGAGGGELAVCLGMIDRGPRPVTCRHSGLLFHILILSLHRLCSALAR